MTNAVFGEGRHEYKPNRAPIDSEKQVCLDCGKPPSDTVHDADALVDAGGVKVEAKVVDMNALRKPDGAKPKNNSELISVMNAQALAQDNADLRNQVTELKDMMAKLNHVIASIQKQQQGMSITIAQTHGESQDTKTRLKAHMRDEHGLEWRE